MKLFIISSIVNLYHNSQLQLGKNAKIWKYFEKGKVSV